MEKKAASAVAKKREEAKALRRAELAEKEAKAPITKKALKEEIKEELKKEAKKEIEATFVKAIDVDGSDIVEIGGVERERHDANILRLEWAIKFPMLSPQEFLLHEKDYSPKQAHRIFEVSGGEAEWRDERDKLLNGVTETLIKRNIDKIVEMKETHIKLSQLGMAKIAEMMSKMQIEPVLNEEGKLMIDPRTKRPVYRGFRSIDLLNCASALSKFQDIQDKAMGVAPDLGMAQIADAIKSHSAVQINVQNNLTIEEAPKSKMEQIVEKLEYEDIAELIKERRAMKRLSSGEEEIIE